MTSSGADSIRIVVGSSSSATSGAAGPLTFGSSLTATARPLNSRVDWLLTRLPLAITGASVASNSMSTVSPLGPRLSPAMSRRPVPAAPPFGSVAVTLAAGGTVTTVSDPGRKDGAAFSASSSSTIEKPSSGVSERFSTYRL